MHHQLYRLYGTGVTLFDSIASDKFHHSNISPSVVNYRPTLTVAVTLTLSNLSLFFSSPRAKLSIWHSFSRYVENLRWFSTYQPKECLHESTGHSLFCQPLAQIFQHTLLSVWFDISESVWVTAAAVWSGPRRLTPEKSGHLHGECLLGIDRRLRNRFANWGRIANEIFSPLLFCIHPLAVSVNLSVVWSSVSSWWLNV